MLDLLLHIVYVLSSWRFGVLFAFLVGPIVAGLLIGRLLPRGWPRRVSGLLAVLLGGYALLNVVFGPDVSTRLVYRFGETGEATITGSYGTSTQYNDRAVVGHRVLLRAADGRTVETSFEDDDFNVYPPRNATIYPGQGDRFTVRYLSRFPQDFVIVSNDDSPWAQSLRCNALMAGMAGARAKYQFAPTTEAYRVDYVNALEAVMKAKCGGDGLARALRIERDRVEAGRP